MQQRMYCFLKNNNIGLQFKFDKALFAKIFQESNLSNKKYTYMIFKSSIVNDTNMKEHDK